MGAPEEELKLVHQRRPALADPAECTGAQIENIVVRRMIFWIAIVTFAMAERE